MSNNLLNTLKLSGSILGIYSLSLAISPTAYADTNISNGSGTTSYANGFVSGRGGDGGGGGGGAGSKANEANATSALATIKAAQGFTAQLDAKQTAFNAASAAYAEVQSQSFSTPSTPSSKIDAVRFTVKTGGVLGEALTNCGCKNPEVAATPSKPDNSAALAAAKEAQAKAAAELAQAQDRSRQFLADAKKAPQVSTQTTGFSPLW